MWKNWHHALTWFGLYLQIVQEQNNYRDLSRGDGSAKNPTNTQDSHAPAKYIKEPRMNYK